MSLSNRNYEIKVGLDYLDFTFIYDFLTHSYWSECISHSRLKRAMENSINVGVFSDGIQIGYARVISDKATFAYLCDVFVAESARGLGAAKFMLLSILDMPELQGIKRFSLVTKDAHNLYRNLGWLPLKDPTMHMEIDRTGIYKLLNE